MHYFHSVNTPLHSIIQLGTKSEKFLINVKINGISIEMEIDSRAERSTIPLSPFKQKLAGVCKLQSSTVSLQQYNKTPLIVVGECSSQITINQCVIQATFVVVDVHNQLPFLGRDWMALLQFDVSTLINQASQIHHMSGTTLATDIMANLLMFLKINWVFSRELKQILLLMILWFHVFTNLDQYRLPLQRRLSSICKNKSMKVN